MALLVLKLLVSTHMLQQCAAVKVGMSFDCKQQALNSATVRCWVWVCILLNICWFRICSGFITTTDESPNNGSAFQQVHAGLLSRFALKTTFTNNCKRSIIHYMFFLACLSYASYGSLSSSLCVPEYCVLNVCSHHVVGAGERLQLIDGHQRDRLRPEPRELRVRTERNAAVFHSEVQYATRFVDHVTMSMWQMR